LLGRVGRLLYVERLLTFTATHADDTHARNLAPVCGECVTGPNSAVERVCLDRSKDVAGMFAYIVMTNLARYLDEQILISVEVAYSTALDDLIIYYNSYLASRTRYK